ncbi:aldo/keto reductase [Mycobacterium saskatchewanense]|uniref:Aldo/keto reductase n=1 Tax=Mycobacterium saskatchewanense TaxID=220927 RepID=A0AAJ3NQR2_9MYCO|nr:aldo/keto reductase [Mycobacterium saskatchewanense]ORW71628.1 aldo/keto reductase [Mycobacterium saskatchewanense]BBX63586.1 aldo/keto reductase [Mycobacterium saskatchewanense]
MPLDQYVTLGRSGLRVSPLCLGAMTFGEDLGWGTSVEESQQIIDRYIALGGNFIDTANFYTRSHSEKIIGDHIGRHPARRDRLVIATKFSGNLYPGDPNGGGSGRKSVIKACENSLRRLQTDYIDLYWLHMWDPNTPIDETMAALDDLVRAGKVRYLGVSDTPAWKIVEANLIARFRGWSSFVGLQIEYSLLERTVEQDLVPMALEFGLGITPWSPLKSGVLSGKYTRGNHGEHSADRGALVESFLNEGTYAVIDELEVIAKAHETNVAAVALAWVHAQRAVSSIIIGARRLSQLDDNVRAVDVTLSADELGRLDALTTPTFGFPSNMLEMATGMINGGTTVNGVFAPTSEYVMPEGGQPY